MNRIWLEEKLDLKMTCYAVYGTGCMEGFVEFNDNCVTLAYIQYKGYLEDENGSSYWLTFNDSTVADFFEWELDQEFRKEQIKLGFTEMADKKKEMEKLKSMMDPEYKAKRAKKMVEIK